jgi:hypothetical protein
MLALLLEICLCQDYNASMLWGTYRPNLYFGTRARNPDSLLTGLAWFGLESMQSKPWESNFGLRKRYKTFM